MSGAHTRSINGQLQRSSEHRTHREQDLPSDRVGLTDPERADAERLQDEGVGPQEEQKPQEEQEDQLLPSPEDSIEEGELREESPDLDNLRNIERPQPSQDGPQPKQQEEPQKFDSDSARHRTITRLSSLNIKDDLHQRGGNEEAGTSQGGPRPPGEHGGAVPEGRGVSDMVLDMNASVEEGRAEKEPPDSPEDREGRLVNLVDDARWDLKRSKDEGKRELPEETEEDDKTLLLGVGQSSLRAPKSPKREPLDSPGTWMPRVKSEGALQSLQTPQSQAPMPLMPPTLQQPQPVLSTYLAMPSQQPAQQIGVAQMQLALPVGGSWPPGPMEGQQLGPPAVPLVGDKPGTAHARMERWLVRQKRQKQREKERQHLIKWLQEEQQKDQQGGQSQEEKRGVLQDCKAPKQATQKQKGRGGQPRQSGPKKATQLEQPLPQPASLQQQSPPGFAAQLQPALAAPGVVPIRPAPVAPHPGLQFSRPVLPPLNLPDKAPPQPVYEGRLVQLWKQFQQQLRQQKAPSRTNMPPPASPTSPSGPPTPSKQVLEHPMLQMPQNAGPWSPIPCSASLPNLSNLTSPTNSSNLTTLSGGGVSWGGVQAPPSSSESFSIFSASGSDTAKEEASPQNKGALNPLFMGPHQWVQMQSTGGSNPPSPHMLTSARPVSVGAWQVQPPQKHPAGDLATSALPPASSMWQWQGATQATQPLSSSAPGALPATAWRPWSALKEGGIEGGKDVTGGVCSENGSKQDETEGSNWLTREVSLSPAAARLFPLSPTSEMKGLEGKPKRKPCGIPQEEVLTGPGSANSNTEGLAEGPDLTLRL